MAAKDRAYDPKRRPNTFYKGDQASDDELKKRAASRGQDSRGFKVSSLADNVSDKIGMDMHVGTSERVSAKVIDGGKRLGNVYAKDGQGSGVQRAESDSMPISGTRVGKSKALFDGTVSKKYKRDEN